MAESRAPGIEKVLVADATGVPLGTEGNPLVTSSSGGGGGVVIQGDHGSIATPWYVQPTADGATVSLPLPAGASTAAAQATGNASLATLVGNSPALVGGRVPVDGSGVTQPISGTIAVSNFPSGAATSALQTTGNASLATIATNTPALGQAAMAASSPVVIASNQTTLPIQGIAGGQAVLVSGTVAVSNAFALDATLTGGTQRSKLTDGTNNAAVTNSAPSAEYGLVVRTVPAGAAAPSAAQLSDGTASYTGAKTGQFPASLGQTTKAASLSVALASDQVGTPGSAATNVLSVQGVASMTPVQVSQATASNLLAQVSGGAAAGSAVSGNPVLAAGKDTSGNAQSLATDTAGRLRPAVYSYAHVSTLGATVVKSGAGVLRTINIQYTGVAHSLVVYDNTAASGTLIAAITIPAGSGLVSLRYSLAFSTGLTVSYATAAGDATVMYE